MSIISELVQQNNLEEIIKLIENGHSLTERDTTIFIWACRYGQLDIVRYLVDHNIVSDDDRQKAVIYSSMHFEIVKYLVQHNFSMSYALANVCCAKISLQFKIVKYLVEHNCEIDEICIDGQTPLMLASHRGNIDVVKYLVRNNCLIDKKDDDSWSAFAYAYSSGHFKIVKFLIRNKCKIDIPMGQFFVISYNYKNYLIIRNYVNKVIYRRLRI